MFNTIAPRTKKERKRESRLRLLHGILLLEMFAVKSMDVNSNLLRLKLDMVYRDLAMEEAQKRFSEISSTVPIETEKVGEIGEITIGKQKRVRKVVKALVPKSK
jgi:hypothetical protein